MRSWKRSAVDALCGRCGEVVRRGDPVLELRIAYLGQPLSKPKERCRHCAGEPVPADLPPLVEQAPIAAQPKASAARKQPLLAAVGELARDWKHKQSNEREPGEDDE